MNRFVYGKAIDFRFTPLEGGEAGVSVDSLVSARIYEDYPTDGQIADAGSATTGHIGSRVTSWTHVNYEGTGANEYQLAFPPLTDPYPTDPKSTVRQYYVAVNFKYSAGGPTMANVEQIFVHRPDATTDKIRVTFDDVVGLDGSIEDVLSRIEVERHIDSAISYVLAKLRGRGYDPARVFDIHLMNEPTAYLAYSKCCFAMINSGGDSWLEKGRLAREEYQTLFDSAKIGYDFGGDDQPESEEKIPTGAFHFKR